MQLDTLLKAYPFTALHNEQTCAVTGLCQDSRKVEKGNVFFALEGAQSNGHEYIPQAIAQGACAIVYRKGAYTPPPEAPENVTFAAAEQSHVAMAALADCYYDHPSAKLQLVGITGTNGKTTTVTLLFHLFRSLGYSCGLLSTIENRIDQTVYPTTNTTADSLTLNRLMAQMCDHGCHYCFMEVSSHAIDQQRISHLHFTGGIFSNITLDHLDYHKTFAQYIACKKRFFDQLPSTAFALTNIDDKNGTVMVQNTKARVVTYACRQMASYHATILEHSVDGMLLDIDGTQVWSALIGAHNAYNLLAIYACARLLGARKEECLCALSKLQTAPGRLEYLRVARGITAFVDYAHTPDALENVLKTLREVAQNNQKLICVVGCGGNRDRSKRPIMAQIAHKYSDLCVFTSDNPRFEDPHAILEEMMAGLTPQERAKHLCLANRKEAIQTALCTAPDHAIVLVAGKGHENYQIVQGVKSHFDDKEIIAAYVIPSV